jgi:hypothetical protein
MLSPTSPFHNWSSIITEMVLIAPDVFRGKLASFFKQETRTTESNTHKKWALFMILIL